VTCIATLARFVQERSDLAQIVTKAMSSQRYCYMLFILAIFVLLPPWKTTAFGGGDVLTGYAVR